MPVTKEEINKANHQDWNKFEGVDTAYEIALRVDMQVFERAKVWDSALQQVLTWGSTVTAGIWGFFGSRLNILQLDFYNFWFVAASIFLVLAFACAIYGRLLGDLKLLGGEDLLDVFSLKTRAFKATVVGWSVDYLKHNLSVVRRRAAMATIAAALFALHALCFISWATLNLQPTKEQSRGIVPIRVSQTW